MRRRFALILFPVLLFWQGHASAALCITDDGGDRICLEAPATRIVPLYAAFTDILSDMGLASRIAGRTRADTGPDGALPSTVPYIGTHMRPNAELVLGLRPHLVLQMGGRAEAAESVASLRALGIPTAFFQAHSFADLFSVIQRVGVLTGAEDHAAELVRTLRARLAALETKLSEADAPIPSVFFEVRYPNLLGAGPDSIVTDVIRAAGGRNVLAHDDSRSNFRTGKVARLSEEELLRLDPDVYCVQTGPMNKNPVPPENRPHFAHLRAVRSGNVLFVDEHLFSRPGSRAVNASEILARALHPGLFAPSQETPKP